MQLGRLPRTIRATSALAVSSEIADRPEVRFRLDALERWQQARAAGLSSTQAAEVVGVPRSTLYRWHKKLQRQGACGLANCSRRPFHLRRSRLIDATLRCLLRDLRKHFPAFGKAKLHTLMCNPAWLRRGGDDLAHLADRIEALPVVPSESTIGRALTLLMRRGEICRIERSRNARRRLAKRKARRPWATRSTQATRNNVREPGQMLQLDTLRVYGLPGQRVVQFTAVDVVSRYTVVEAYSAATARCAARFLTRVLAEMPFEVRAMQVDGGSEFKAEFEEACQRLNLPLYELPPRSPDLNGRVERAHGSWRYEVYAAHDWPWPLSELRPWLKHQQHLVNFVRPHQALGQRPPADYLLAHFPKTASHPALSHMW